MHRFRRPTEMSERIEGEMVRTGSPSLNHRKIWWVRFAASFNHFSYVMMHNLGQYGLPLPLVVLQYE